MSSRDLAGARQATRPRWALPGLAVVLLAGTFAALAATGALTDVRLGSEPGQATRVALAAARGVHDLAAALCVGLLVVAAAVLPAEPGRPPGQLGSAQARAVRYAALAGAGWVTAGLTVLALTYADVAGSSPLAPGAGAQVRFFVAQFDLGRALAVSLLLALVATGLATVATRVTTTAWAALAGLGALLPLALGGHSATASNHDMAVDTLAAHLVGVSVWLGGLFALLVLRPVLGPSLAAVAGRYSRLAGWSFALVAGSGVLGAVARLGSRSALVSAYGALLGAKSVILVVLGVAGWAQRRRLLARLADDGPRSGGPGAFARLAGLELALLGLAVGLGVALARTPTPGGRPVASRTEELLGRPLPPPLTPAGWVLQWRLDVLFLGLAALALGWYLWSVRRLRARGDRWPVGRTVSWATGWAVFAWATSSGPGVYGDVLFSMHMVSHMTIAMAVPIFLVLGAPVSLALRVLPSRKDGSRGPREWLLAVVHSRALAVFGNPLVAAGIFLGSLVVFYYSPLFELALSTHTGHALMTMHFLLTGYLFASVICGVDPGPRRPPHVFRLLLMMATMGFHAFFGVAMMGGTEILGQEWFASLDRPWGRSLAQEQNLGGALAWALGDYPVAIMVLAMSVQWIRADERESRRYDRQADRDDDAGLAAYNDYLRRLGSGRSAP